MPALIIGLILIVLGGVTYHFIIPEHPAVRLEREFARRAARVETPAEERRRIMDEAIEEADGIPIIIPAAVDLTEATRRDFIGQVIRAAAIQNVAEIQIAGRNVERLANERRQAEATVAEQIAEREPKHKRIIMPKNKEEKKSEAEELVLR